MDQGAILPLDMNSYLLNQMYTCAALARYLGDESTAAEVSAQADALAARMVEVFYDADANLFLDVLLKTGEKLELKTPASFLPLWAGVPLPKERARTMITDYLLNPAYFFGAVPFPSVAYDEPGYESGRWWRGPTWLPVAYLMLEVLLRYGFKAEWRAAAERLYAMIVADGRISELFDSQTGEGLGAAQQGWTAGILLRLNRELHDES
jgi:glycogen debranching enzyme